MWGHGIGFGWVGMLVGGLMMLLFWGGLFALLFLLFRNAFGSGQAGGIAGTSRQMSARALEVLKDRYARGEITKADYHEIRADLVQ